MSAWNSNSHHSLCSSTGFMSCAKYLINEVHGVPVGPLRAPNPTIDSDAQLQADFKKAAFETVPAAGVRRKS